MDSNAAGQEPDGFEWVHAPDDLLDILNSLYVLRTGKEPVQDMMPTYSGQLLVNVSGGGRMDYGGAKTATMMPEFFQCPLTQARAFEIDPGTVMLGVSFNFRGWSAFTGLSSAEHHDCNLPVDQVLPPALASGVADVGRRVRAGEIDEHEALILLAGIVRDGPRRLAARHDELITQTLAWLSSSLNPPIEDLHARLPYSERQVQRLVKRFFGMSPQKLARRYRAMRAATMLSMPDLDPAMLGEIRDAFYDQAHMIREIRHFTGRTMARLGTRERSVVNDTLREDGYGAVDLFGGSEAKALGKE